MDAPQWIDGQIAVEAALRAGNRNVLTIYIRQDRLEGRLARLRKEAQRAGVPVDQVTAEMLGSVLGGEADAVAAASAVVAAKVGPRRFLTLDVLADRAAGLPIVMLDGVEDPYNFGQAVRSLYAAGVGGLVVRPRNWFATAGIVTRASAGATEFMPTAVADNVEAAAAFFRERHRRIACADPENAVSIYDADLSEPLFLIVGGERRGITRSFLRAADLRLAIPYGRSFPQALGASSAAAVIAFEMMRQRASGRPTENTPPTGC